MIRLLQFLFYGHVHTWKTIGKVDLQYTNEGKVTDTGSRYVQQCEGCGKVVKRDII